MLYDARQRPQAVCLRDAVFIGFKAGASPSKSRKAKTSPMLISYDRSSRRFSEPLTLGRATSDHHHGPVIWADREEYLHVLYGCHKTPGTHLVARRSADMGRDISDWARASEIAPKLSYPTVFRIHGDRDLIYYRTDGHASSWTYRISDDNGRTWTGPDNDVTDLDSLGRAEWSSYQTKLPSEDGRHLHVVFTDYDDVKSNDPKRLFNERYKQPVSNAWKYNLSYIKVDLETHAVRNADGDVLNTPIDIDQAKEKARIWDTEGRGAGVPPAIALDEEGEPTFLGLQRGLERNQVELTVEMYPEEGKYHHSGHRRCGVSLTTAEVNEHGSACPVCKRPVTLGVMQRVGYLAQRADDTRRDEDGLIHSEDGRPPFRSLVSLQEILSEAMGVLLMWEE